MEANNIFKKFFKSLKIDKNNSQNLAPEKIVKSLCCTNLKYAFSILLFYEEMFSENREEKLITIFFSQENWRIGFQSPWQRPVKSQVTRPFLHLHNICIIAKKRNFNLSYWVLRSQNRPNTHYSWNRQDSKHKTAIRRVFSRMNTCEDSCTIVYLNSSLWISS